MININKQALREAATKATGAHDRLSVMPADDIFDISQHEGTQLDADITALNAFNEAANPAIVLALLDELEEAEYKRENVIRVNCGLFENLTAAERRIAELESERDKQGRHACELFDEVTSQRQQIAELVAAGIITKVGE